jgi:hypothetical protein
MIIMDHTLNVTDGLLKDPISGDYRVLSGYSHQTLRYSIDETWLDEDDNLWVKREAVEREAAKQGHNHTTNGVEG